MNRRRFIAAAVAATAFPGCLETPPGRTDGTDSPTGDPSDTPAGTPTASPEPTSQGPELVDRSFEVTDVRCGSEYGTHDVVTADGTVTVEGVLDGRNTCYTADLIRGEYDPDADTLTVEVEAREDDDAEGCGQCIVEVHYVASFEFDHGTPGRIEVEQRGATTTSGSTSESGSGSASAGGATADDGSTSTDTPEAVDD